MTPNNALDASTFQKPLGQLAEVMAQKLKREAPKILAAPNYVSVDLHVLMRQAMNTYDLIFYLNADERRETDPYWRITYSVTTFPLIRTMIDCLYNITAILQDPAANGTWFRKSGYRKMLTALDEDAARYGGQPEWDEWIEKVRKDLDFEIRANSLRTPDIMAVTSWPTMGKYISDKQPGGTITAHQDFLKTFTFGRWREYSAISHGAFEGLKMVGMYFITDSFSHEDRERVDKEYPKVLSLHVARAALVLLCIITEAQAYFRFQDDGADINNRIHKMWDALMPVFEVKELYNERYSQLMKDKGM